MDYNAKMEELEALWSDSFELCKAMIASCKSGDQRLTGSILKELNAFIKQSVDFLRFREAEQVFSEQEEEEEDEELLKMVESMDLDEDEPLDIPDEGFPMD
ncbi:hypothetical protein [uncultured Desulfosarcina sp.]|uniref:hypothetical protein n=1 Tax=uncultured Desulfosarcina sp. TaxID=218289 RepID=UPI0029C91B48|nr:hypothetical protein [uncultured Desulfosarcina sp.]